MIILRKEEMFVEEWRLMDVDEYRLKSTGNFVKKMFEDAKMPAKVIMTQDLKEAVAGCHFVICTIRPGLSNGRVLDETIPFNYNLIGQETTAPGGMIMGFKTIPAVLEIAGAIERFAAKRCYLINLANPSGMVSEALNRHATIKFAGLCNGPTVIRKAMRALYGAENPNDVFVQVTGLNHLIWCKVFFRGEDVTNDAFKRLLDWSAVNVPPLRTEFVEPDLQQFIGWIPMGPYLRFYYDYQRSFEDLRDSSVYWPAVLEKVRKNVGDVLDDIQIPAKATRAEITRMVEKRTFELYDQLDARGYAMATNTRGGKDYGEAGVALINAIWNNKNEIQSPDVAGMGTLQGLPADCVCTTTSLVNAAGIHPLAFPKLPGHMMSKILAAKEYEKLAVEAAVTGNYHAALEALTANPLIHSYYDAKGALDALLIAEKNLLPKFEEAITVLEKGITPETGKENMR
jgi:6-phospho-beta-glucosidase